MIEALRNHILTCPFLKATEQGYIVLGIEYLSGETTTYSLELAGGDVWYKQFYNGKGIMQLNFVFASTTAFSKEYETNLETINFYDNFYNWFTKTKLLYPMQKVTLSRPQIQFASSGEDSARYQIAGNLLYLV